MNTLRRFCRRAWPLHAYLIVSMMLLPLPQSGAYWTDPDLDGVKEWVEGPPTEDAWWDLDSDGDTLTNAQELIYGSDPHARDSDRDGLSDLVERDYTPPAVPFDPWSWDTDGNGVSDHDQYYQWIQGHTPVVNYNNLGGTRGVNFYDYRDADGDGVPNHEDSDPLTMDRDGDGILNWNDTGYMDDPNNGAGSGTTGPPMDTDGDGIPDETDPYPNGSFTYNGVEYGGSWIDSDNDTIPDPADLFPNGSFTYNGVEYGGSWSDTDGDGIPNPADAFPNDPGSYTYNGTEYGGVMPDRDGDLIPDWADNFPDGSYLHEGVEYAGAWVDQDGDSVHDLHDPFPTIAGSYVYQAVLYAGYMQDADLDGVPDWADNFPNGSYTYNGVEYGGAWADADNDGVPDPADPFPSVAGSYWYNGTEYPGAWMDSDSDGIPDAQDNFPAGSYWYNGIEYGGSWQDADNDLIPDPADLFPNGSYWYNNVEYAGAWTDTDGDGIPNPVDPWPALYGSYFYNNVEYGGSWTDTDGDFIPDPADPWPTLAGSYFYNNVEYGGPWQDADGDGIPDPVDNWPNDRWNGQPYFTYNGVEYAGYWSDRDGDTVPDAADSWPDDPENNADSDNDGLSNYAERTQHYTAVNDVDTDNDYLTDYEELFVFQTNPLLPRTNLAQGQALLDGQVHLGADTDDDGLPDLLEDFYASLGHNLSRSNAADAALDLDSDGFTNLQAFQAGWSLVANLSAYDQDGDRIDDAVEDYWNAVYPGSLDKTIFEDAVADYDQDGLMNYEEVVRHDIGGYLVALDPGDAHSIVTALEYAVAPGGTRLNDGQFLRWWWDVNRADYGGWDGSTPANPIPADAAHFELADTAPANGVPDGYELWDADHLAGHNPPRAVDPDEDGDGMPNGWEHRYVLAPRDAGDAGQAEVFTDLILPIEPDPFDPAFLVDYGMGPVFSQAAFDEAMGLYNTAIATYNDTLAWRASVDPDQDDLPNLGEYVQGTHPHLDDTDGDGFEDGYETVLGLDPNIGTGIHSPEGDFDGDGLSNEIELTETLTGMKIADTDSDGLSDGAEHLTHHTNPKNSDTDGDTLLDGVEVNTFHSNPLSLESDGDGLPDQWEVSNALHPASNTGLDGAGGDPDADSLTNIAEFRSGSNPRDADSDDDLLTDGAEYHTHFSSPVHVDTDEDGLTDYAEVMTHHTYPSLRDSDFDGLSDFQEINAYQTNPLSQDTDGDKMWDSWEAWYGLNPLSAADASLDPDGDGYSSLVEFYYREWGYRPDTPGFPLGAPFIGSPYDDTDGDGLSRYNEVTTHGTNPHDNDTDGDWMWDGWEVSNGFNPASAADQWSDPDGDGLPNCVEFLFNKNPAVSDSAGFAWNADPDLDDLTNLQEITVHHTNPVQTDTDDDGLYDGWEVEAGFNPLVNNDRDFNTRNDANFDTDYDGLTNLLEAYYGINGVLPDTDGDGILDNIELAQASNPRNAASKTPASGGTRSITITWGDPSGSHSEKYAVTMTPTAGGGGAQTFRNAKYGQTETRTVNIPKGAAYTVSLQHIGTSPKYTDQPRPDYDYLFTITENGTSTDSVIVIDDPQGMLGNHTFEHTGNTQNNFFAAGKSVSITSVYMRSETDAQVPANRQRTKLGVAESVFVELLPSSAPAANWSIIGDKGSTSFSGNGQGVKAVQMRAGILPCKPVVVASFGGTTLQMQFNIVRPNTVKMVKTDDTGNTQNPLKVRMECDVYIGPEDVSFAHLMIVEGVCNAVGTDYFSYENGEPHTPAGAVSMTNVLVPGRGWKSSRGDLVQGAAVNPNQGYNNGDFIWDIPWRYKFGTDEELFENSPIRQHKFLRKLTGKKATLTITKGSAKSSVTEP